jgi:hypothetical protein
MACSSEAKDRAGQEETYSCSLIEDEFQQETLKNIRGT